jgi:hypothetical protein
MSDNDPPTDTDDGSTGGLTGLFGRDTEVEPDRPPGAPPVELPPPNVKTSGTIPGSTQWHLWRNHKKRRKYAKNGYVQWYLIGDSYPRPKFIKPERKGGGIREYEHDDMTYLFPEQAMLPSEREGMWTVVHMEGFSDPININDGLQPAIHADELDEYLDLRVTSTAPGWLDGLDLEPADLLKYGIIAIIGYAILRGFLTSGGLPF